MLKYKLMTAVASFAFVAAGVAAQAQDNPKRAERPANEKAETPTPATAPKGETAPQAAQMERKEVQGQESKSAQEPMKQESPKAAATDRKENPKAAETEQKEPAKASNAERKEQAPKAAETERHETPKAAQTDRKEMKGDTQGAKETPRAAQMRDEKKDNMKPAANEPAQKNDARAEGRGPVRAEGKVRISSEHATRVSETLLREARRERVDFDVRVGVRVPEKITVRPLPEDVIAIVPEYRGYDYFVDSNDDIVFVSPETHEIVGTIDYEGRAAAEERPMHGARPCPIEN